MGRAHSRLSDFLDSHHGSLVLYDRIVSRPARRYLPREAMRILLRRLTDMMLGRRLAMEVVHNALIGKPYAFGKILRVTDNDEGMLLDFIYSLLSPSWAFYYLVGVS